MKTSMNSPRHLGGYGKRGILQPAAGRTGGEGPLAARGLLFGDPRRQKQRVDSVIHMIVRTASRATVLAAAAVLILARAFAADGATAQGRKRALLIGIDRYDQVPGIHPHAADLPPSARSWPNLEGGVNDALAWRDLLVTRFGFAPADISILTNAQATRWAITNQIARHLIDGARPDDLRVFQFSGHGSQVTNALSKEIDGMDESIVPSDSALGVADVRDKELRRYFNRLIDVGNIRLAVIFDCCRSGSGLRGPGGVGRVRWVPSAAQAVADREVAPAPEERPGVTVLSAAQDNQPAREFDDLGRQRPHGAFTWSLLWALNTGPRDQTLAEAFQRAEAWLASRGFDQRPVLAGLDQARRGGFLGGVVPIGTTLRVVASPNPFGAGVRIATGLAGGVQPGAVFRLIGSDPPVRMRVTEAVTLLSAEAKIIEGTLTAHESGELFEFESPGTLPPAYRLRLWAPGEVGSEAGGLAGTVVDRVQLKENLKRVLGATVEWASSTEDAHYQLVPRETMGQWTIGWEACSGNEGRLPGSDWLCMLIPRSPSNAVPGRGISDTALLASMTVDLARHATNLARSLMWLQVPVTGPTAAFPYRLGIRHVPSGQVLGWTNQFQGDIFAGEDLDIFLEREPTGSRGRPHFVYLFAVDALGRTAPIYPLRGQGNVENRIPRNDNAALVAMEEPLRRIRVGAPAGNEVVVLVASMEPWQPPEDPQALGFEGRGEAGDRGGVLGTAITGDRVIFRTWPKPSRP